MAVARAPIAAAQQPAKVWRIGILSASKRPASPDKRNPRIAAFVRRLAELGYVEGKNVAFEWRFAEDDYTKLPELAADLVRSRVDIIQTAGSEGISAAQQATKTIPIVFLGGTDVVAQGFVKSLANPGGNATGITIMFGEFAAKQMELLKTLVPKASRIAVLYNSSNPASPLTLKIFLEAGKTAGVQIVPIPVSSGGHLEDAFARVADSRPHAMIWALDNFFIFHEAKLADLSARHRIPCIGGVTEYPDLGGLVAYAPDQIATNVHLADFVDRIFKGANPADLPVERPTKLQLVINRKAASALGLTIPPELLVLADRVIE